LKGKIRVPEGPELKHSRDRLREVLVDKYVTRLISSPSGRYKTKMPEGMSEIAKDLPLKVESIDTKGKFMWWTLAGKTKTWYVWCTYGMSGQWSKQSGKHVSFIVEFNGSGELAAPDQCKLFFNDARRFGTIKFVNNQMQHDKKLRSLGPDVLEDPPIDPEVFAKRILNKPNRTIAEALMDQSCVSGVGNYLKSEVLYRAGVAPHRVVTDISSEEILSLWSEVILSCRESYADHGASLRTYKTVDEENGNAQFFFRVYGLKQCAAGHPVRHEETADGRTSWWCETCQN